MIKLVFVIAILFSAYSLMAQHEGIERHFSEYVHGDFIVAENNYSSDTLTDYFHIFGAKNPFLFSTGNAGGAHTPAFFIDRYPQHEFVFLTPYTPFISNSGNSKFFNVRKPFTTVSFIGGTKQMDNISFIHTQNIKPWLNFGAEYSSLNSKGQYARQQLKSHKADLWIDYSKDRYSAYIRFLHNKISHENNGGIGSDYDFEQRVQRPENLSVALLYSTTQLAQTGIVFTHEYIPGSFVRDSMISGTDTLVTKKYNSRFRISHNISLNRYYRIYEDKPSAFYSNIFLDSVQTFDSLGLRKIHNSLMLKYIVRSGEGRLTESGIAAGVISDLAWYNMAAGDFSNYIRALWFSKREKLLLSISGNFGFTGHHAGDIHVDAEALYSTGTDNKHEFGIKSKIDIFHQDDFYNSYLSNHFIWSIPDDTEQKANLGLSYSNTQYAFGTEVHYYYLHRYLYFDAMAMPAFNSDPCNIVSATVNKHIRFGILNWYNHIQAQYISDNTAYSLPAMGLYSSLYVKAPVLKNKMIFQAGIDARYMTTSGGFAYMPATGVFYSNQTKEYGNFVILDFHSTIKIKRFRAFVKVSHFNEAFMAANYYSLLHYPANPLAFNFGISWEFYD